MTEQLAREYKKAIFEFEANIKKALDSPYVKKPIAWALYQTWKAFDNDEKERDTNGLIQHD